MMGVQELVDEDIERLADDDPTKLLANAKCFKPSDEEFIRQTIQNRLGGARQVTLIVKQQIQKAVDIETIDTLEAGTNRGRPL
jgi:hypothetical protein